jgi:SAM-dependent methyltransferase
MIKTVLNIGCGFQRLPLSPEQFPAGAWREIRLDIDPAVEPDIVASITDMTAIPDAAVDVVWSSHNLEHLYPHDIAQALRECFRVLQPGGMALFSVPDLEAVAAVIARGDADKPLYVSDAGPVTPLDILYGYAPALARNMPLMGHRWGFTPETLARAFADAGFVPAAVCRAQGYELRIKAFRPPVPPLAATSLSED